MVYTAGSQGGLEIMVVPGHTGTAAQAERELGELLRVARPVADRTQRMSYVELVFMHPDAPGRRHWELARFPFGAPPEPQLDALLEQLDRGGLRPGRALALWRTVAGAVPDPPSAAPRLPGITIFPMSRWDDPRQDESELAWVERTAAGLARSGVVAEAANTVNHVASLDQQRLRRLYGNEAYRRLAELKLRYDPDNVFKRNANILPATAVRQTAPP